MLPAQPHARTSDGFGRLLRDTGFRAFLWTQFLGAFNDNVYKIIVSMRAVHLAAGGHYLSLAGAVFVLPFLLFSGYSGHLADAVPKRSVLISIKIFEIAVMLFGLAAFFSTRIELMLVVLFLMALHSTIFSPAKYGIVPEMLPAAELSRANALLEMSTFVAIVMGTSIGAFFFTLWKNQPWNMGFATLAIAVAGLLTSFGITRVPAAGATGKFLFNPFSEVLAGTRHLLLQRQLWLSVVGISYFWFLGALFQLDLLLFGSEVLRVSDLQVGLLITSLAVGIGVGSMLSGRLSGNKIELGLVPLGSLLMAVFSVALFFTRHSYRLSVADLMLLGISSGLFIVPLNAFLQHRSDPHEKGRILATNNFYNTVGMLLASGMLWSLHDKLHVAPDKLILVCGLLTLLVTAYIVWVLPRYAIRFSLWLLMHTFYRFQILGREHAPNCGPALLVSNHMSWIDGFLVGACIQRFLRYMIWKPYFEARGFHSFLRFIHAIPVDESNPRQIVYSIRRARQELQDGHVVCIFAEGSMTRTGNLLPFKRGLEKIVAGLDAPVIPVHLSGVWGSIFSFSGGRFLKKWPLRVPYRITVSFGAPMPLGATNDDARQAVQELGSEAATRQVRADDRLDLQFLRVARRHWSRPAIADADGRRLTYGQTLSSALVLARQVRAAYTAGSPVPVSGALAHIAVVLAGRVPVNAPDALSEAMLARASWFDRFRANVAARLLPAKLLLTAQTPYSPAAITGSPDVLLSHANVVSNIAALQQLLWLTPDDRVAGVLPLSDPFGLTLTLWLPLLTGCGALYPPREATVLIATPALYEEYVQCCSREDLGSVRMALSVGAPLALAAAFQEKFGRELLEVYGCAEMTAVIALNSPNRSEGDMLQIGHKPGTQGHPLPGVAITIVDEAGVSLPPGRQGRLLVKGPSRMLGYVGQTVSQDAWFDTNAQATMDSDGFLTLVR